MVARDDEGDEAEEDDVDVMDLGFVFLNFRPVVLVREVGGAASLLRFSKLVKSLLWLPIDSGSEQGLRNGDLLSLSLQKTTAIEPPTTELPAPPPVPPGPKRSMPSFPEPTDAPVVLLTPSRTKTDTLDCSFPFRLPPPSFLGLPARPKSFLRPLSRSLSFPIFLARFVEVRPDAMDVEPEVTVSEDRHSPLFLMEDGDEYSAWSIFFFIL